MISLACRLSGVGRNTGQCVAQFVGVGGPLLSLRCDTILRMADDDWFKPNRPAPPSRQSKPGEHVWSLRRNGKQIDCELRFHGESYGWECQCLHDGLFAHGQRFILREGAMAEAAGQRQRLMKEGWGPYENTDIPHD